MFNEGMTQCVCPNAYIPTHRGGQRSFAFDLGRLQLRRSLGAGQERRAGTNNGPASECGGAHAGGNKSVGMQREPEGLGGQLGLKAGAISNSPILQLSKQVSLPVTQPQEQHP